MRRLVLALAVLMLVPASAQAATTISPQKQAQLNSHGWTAGDDDSFAGDASTTMPAGATGNCTFGRARRAGSALRNARNDPMVRGALKLAVCASNGRITAHDWIARHASPGHNWHTDGIGQSCSTSSVDGRRGIRVRCSWAWHYGSGPYSEFRIWDLFITVVARVRRGTEHQIVFSTTRRWS